MSEMRDGKPFTEILRLIRNTVSGHVMGDTVGVQNSAIWVMTPEDVPRNVAGVMRSQIVLYAVKSLSCLLSFATELQQCLVVAEPVITARGHAPTPC